MEQELRLQVRPEQEPEVLVPDGNELDGGRRLLHAGDHPRLRLYERPLRGVERYNPAQPCQGRYTIHLPTGVHGYMERTDQQDPGSGLHLRQRVVQRHIQLGAYCHHYAAEQPGQHDHRSALVAGGRNAELRDAVQQVEVLEVNDPALHRTPTPESVQAQDV